jgi:hypothetical protein
MEVKATAALFAFNEHIRTCRACADFSSLQNGEIIHRIVTQSQFVQSDNETGERVNWYLDLELFYVLLIWQCADGYSRARYALLRFGHTPIAAMYFAQTSSSELEIQGKHAFIYSRVSAERQRARVSTASRSISAFCCRRFSGDKGTSTLCEAAISSPEL